MRMLTPGIALGLLLTASAGADDSPLDRRNHKQVEDELSEQLKAVNDKCGTKIQVTFDWRSFTSREIFERYSVSGYCAPPLNAMLGLCDEEDAKEAIRKKVKRVVCRYGGSDGRRRAMRVRAGTIDWKLDLEAINNDGFARETLRRSL